MGTVGEVVGLEEGSEEIVCKGVVEDGVWMVDDMEEGSSSKGARGGRGMSFKCYGVTSKVSFEGVNVGALVLGVPLVCRGKGEAGMIREVSWEMEGRVLCRSLAETMRDGGNGMLLLGRVRRDKGDGCRCGGCGEGGMGMEDPTPAHRCRLLLEAGKREAGVAWDCAGSCLWGMAGGAVGMIGGRKGGRRW